MQTTVLKKLIKFYKGLFLAVIDLIDIAIKLKQTWDFIGSYHLQISVHFDTNRLPKQTVKIQHGWVTAHFIYLFIFDHLTVYSKLVKKQQTNRDTWNVSNYYIFFNFSIPVLEGLKQHYYLGDLKSML